MGDSSRPTKKQRVENESGMTETKFDYDLIVLGGGSGGMAAAKEAKKLNKKLKVAIFDFVKPSPAGTTWGLGGTCVNVGCIPKKLMHYSGLLGHAFEASKEFGWNFSDPSFSWDKMSEEVRNYIGSLNWSYKRQLTGAGIKYFHNFGYLVDKHTIGYEEKNSEKRVTAQYIIIATGGRPFYGDTPGKELSISSDDIFWKKTNPGKTLVIGGGYIAVECAGFLHEMKLGDVTLMNRSVVMRKFDEQCAAQIGELMERSGIRIILKAKPLSFAAKKENFPAIPEGSKEIKEGERKGQIEFPSEGDGKVRHLLPSGAIEVTDLKTKESTYKHPKGPIVVTWKIDGDGKTYTEEFDTVLVALGRKANIANIGLEKAGVRVNFGKILVDEVERTTTENIFALGDVATQIKEHGLKDGTAVFVDHQGKGNESDYYSGVITAVKDGKYDIRSTQHGHEGKTFQDVDEKHLHFRSNELPELTPVAIQAAGYLAKRLFAKGTIKMQYKLIPTTVFSTPEYGTIGLTTEEAEREEKEGGIGKENVEIWYSRYGPIEQTPSHPHYVTPRSNLLHGKNLWARQYAEKHKIWWPDTGFDEADYSTVVYDDGKTKIDATVTNHSQNENGDWVYDLETEDGKKYDGVHPKYLELRGEAVTFRYERYVKSNHLAKLVVDKRNGKVVGFHFIGSNAGEVTQGFALGLLLGATKEQFDYLTGIHPTAAEEFSVLEVTRSSQQNFLKQEGCGGGSC